MQVQQAIRISKVIVVGADDANENEVMLQALSLSNNDRVNVEVTHKEKRYTISAVQIAKNILKDIEKQRVEKVEAEKKQEAIKKMEAGAMKQSLNVGIEPQQRQFPVSKGIGMKKPTPQNRTAPKEPEGKQCK